MQPGTQVVYIPNHAQNDATHPDCEYGFVTSVSEKNHTAFVTYFRKGTQNLKRTLRLDDIRSRSASECTPLENLKPFTFATQKNIDSLREAVIGERTTARTIYQRP